MSVGRVAVGVMTAALSWSTVAGAQKVVFAPVIDYWAFTQDSISHAQVGNQRSQVDVREVRLSVEGGIGKAALLRYRAMVEYKGFESEPADRGVGISDLYLTASVGAIDRITVGQFAEPWSFEKLSSVLELPQQERILDAFVRTRNAGVLVGSTLFDQRATWTTSWANDWLPERRPWNHTGNQFTARVTALPVYQRDSGYFVHLGLDARYDGADNDTIQFRARPESKITSYYVDTGKLPADHAVEMDGEAVAAAGPFLFTSEYALVNLASTQTGNPTLVGFYTTLSYVITGEHRPYDKSIGITKGLKPTRTGGAWEVLGRYSHVDFDQGALNGGVQDRWSAGLTWWAHSRWRVGAEYGYTVLTRSGIHGVTQMGQTRVQWVN